MHLRRLNHRRMILHHQKHQEKEDEGPTVGIQVGLGKMVEVLVVGEAEHRCNQNATVGLWKIRRIFTISELTDRHVSVGIVVLKRPNGTSISTIVDGGCR